MISPLYNPELDRSISQPVASEFAPVLALLDSPELHEEITKGNVTLAMIRPHVGPEANLLGLPDLEATDHIEESIGGLAVITKFSFTFTHDAVDVFYGGGPQASMEKEKPIDPAAYQSRWLEFRDFMASAPTTALLLYSPDGDAISRWRSHLGHWNIDEIRDPSTIRGAFGVNKYNNLVHGSDEPAAVLNELSIIKQSIKDAERSQ